MPVILGEIKRIFRDSGSVKVGRALKERSRAALKRREEITLSLGREPTVGELAQSLGIEAAEAAMLINASMPVMSLTVGENAGEQLDVPVASPEDEISDLIALRQAVDSLDERDKHMIEMRYYDGMTQSAVAAVLPQGEGGFAAPAKKIELTALTKTFASIKLIGGVIAALFCYCEVLLWLRIFPTAYTRPW